MTSVEFLKLVARRWYIVLLGLGITAAASWAAAGPSTVYFSRTTVNILEPNGGNARILGYHSPDSIAVANILAARVNGGVHTPLASNPDVTLYSMGILQGTHAQVRNVGGQWLSQVTEPVVDVQVVDSSSQAVEQRLRTEVANIGEELTLLEDQLKVPRAERIELQLSPPNPPVDRVTTNHPRALVGYGLFGTGLTLAATYWIDRLLRRRRAGLAQDHRGSAQDTPGATRA